MKTQYYRPRIPFELDIMRQVYKGEQRPYNAEVIYRSGNNAAVANAYEDIWTPGGLMTYFDAAQDVEILSSSVDDDIATGAAGATSVQIHYLDGNYVRQEIEVDLTGTVAVDPGVQMLRVWRMHITGVGTNPAGTNLGTITLRTQSGATTMATIPAGEGSTKQTQYTIPAGKIGFLSWMSASINQAATSNTMHVAVYSRDYGEAFRERIHIDTPDGVGMSYLRTDYSVFFGPKSDITMRAENSAAATLAVSAQYGFILMDA